MATAHCMSASQSHSFLVIKAQAMEYITQVLLALGAIGQTAVRRRVLNWLVNTTWALQDCRTAHLLDSNDATQCPQV